MFLDKNFLSSHVKILSANGSQLNSYLDWNVENNSHIEYFKVVSQKFEYDH